MAFTKVDGPGIHTLANITSHNVHSSGIITATKFDGPFDNINVSGAATFTGNVTIGGTLTYEDVTNIDSVGLVTARDGIFLPDNKEAKFGNTAANPDLKIYHDGSRNVIDTVSANLQIKHGSEKMAVFAQDGQVELYHNNSQKFKTLSTGAQVNGTLSATHFSGSSEVGIQSGGVQIGAGITQLNFVGTGNTFAVNGTTVDISIQGGGGGGSGAFTTSITGIQTTSQIVGIGTTSTDDSDLQGIGNSARGMYVSNGMIIMDNLVSGNHYIGTNFNGLMVGPVNIEGTISIDGNYVVV